MAEESPAMGALDQRARGRLDRERILDAAQAIADDDEALATFVAELAVRAARQRGSAAAIEGASLTLELQRLERAITARRGHGDVAPLSARREELRRRLDRAIERAMAEQPAG
jgi:hypothetical protein